MIVAMSKQGLGRYGMAGWLDQFDQGEVRLMLELSGRTASTGHVQPGSIAREHHLLLLVLAGQGVYISRGESVSLAPGSVLWVQPAVTCDFTWKDPTELLYVGFDVQVHGRPTRLRQDRLFSAEAWSVLEKLEQILDELVLPMPQSPRRTRWLLGLAVTDVMRLHSRYQRAGGLSATQRSRLTQFVARRGVQPTYVSDLAGLLEWSEDYFTRRFRLTFGQNPQAWLMRQRMLATGRLMRDSGLTATQVARAAGYTDLSQFSRQFRRTLGIPPSRYRRG